MVSFNKQKLVNGYLLVVNKLLLECFSFFFNHDSKIFGYFTNVNQGNKELAKLSTYLQGANLFEPAERSMRIEVRSVCKFLSRCLPCSNHWAAVAKQLKRIWFTFYHLTKKMLMYMNQPLIKTTFICFYQQVQNKWT